MTTINHLNWWNHPTIIGDNDEFLIEAARKANPIDSTGRISFSNYEKAALLRKIDQLEAKIKESENRHIDNLREDVRSCFGKLADLLTVDELDSLTGEFDATVDYWTSLECAVEHLKGYEWVQEHRTDPDEDEDEGHDDWD